MHGRADFAHSFFKMFFEVQGGFFLHHEIAIENMIHGPCGTFNPNSPCMADVKCSKRYPRGLVAETITWNYGYPLYRRRSTADNGRSTIVIVNQLTNSMAYGTRRFNAAFTRALQ